MARITKNGLLVFFIIISGITLDPFKCNSLNGKEAGIRKYAIFDFDGTLSRGYISMDFLDYLHQKGQFDPGQYGYQMEILKEHKAGKLSYDKWVDEWAISWAKGLKGQKMAEIEKSAGDFFKRFKNNIYPKSKAAANYLKERGFELFLLSSGAHEVVDEARKYLNMDKAIATMTEIQNGVYTGRLVTNVHTSKGKGEFIGKMLKQEGYGEPALVFGDSTGDISMLTMARKPVALNPRPELEAYAHSKGWTVLKIKDLMDFLRTFVK